MFDKRKGSEDGPAEVVIQDKPVAAPMAAVSKTPRAPAVIGATITIKGDVSGQEDLIIDGTIHGTVDLRGNDVTVGRTGRLDANVSANVVKIDGEVTGDVTGVEKVIISRTGKVKGNVVAPRVTLEDGAQFKGSIDMDPGERNSKESAPRAAAAVAAAKVASTPAAGSADGTNRA